MIHKGDIGAKIRLIPDEDTDLSSGINASVRAKKPSGAVVVWPATIAQNAVQYITGPGDIDEEGQWIFQGYVDLGTWRGSSEKKIVTIGGVLE